MFKKLTAALLSMTLLAGAAAMPAAAAESYSMGDVDMNGVIDSRDAGLALEDYISLQLMYIGDVLTEEQKVYADVDVDGEIDTVDALKILYYYVYAMVVESPVTSDMFFADFAKYEDELFQAVGVDDAADHAMSETAEEVDGVYYKGEE